jgi:Zn finger protein HypA/HybF involved in hydrogenase expression
MISILECFDSELVERTNEALAEAGIAFTLTAIEQEPLRGWNINVSEDVSAKGAAMVEAVAQTIESERSHMRCLNCGTGMIVVGPESEKDEGDPPFVEYRCPKCGTPGLSNLS